MNLANYKKILVIRLSSLGDILLTTPLLRSIKQQFPEIEIDYIIRTEYESTITHNPHINEIISLSRNYDLKSIRKNIVNENYDLIIDLQNNIRSNRLTKGSKCQIVRYKKPYFLRTMLVKFNWNIYKEIIPIPVRYAMALSNFTLDNDGIELFLPNNVENIARKENFIGFCPGSRHETKMWPKNYFIELGKNLYNHNYKVLLFGGRDDKAICAEIAEQIPESIDLSNDNNLIELARNMKSCKAIVCNDSGLMHTAVGVNIPVIAIFGSTVEEFGFYPYKGTNLILENKSLSCRPCSHIGLDKCPKKHFDCLKKISPDYVFNESLNFLKVL